MNAPATRRTYLDVLRGVAVLVMIEAHVIDSWTRDADRHTRAFGESLILGGFGAPLFLFLAGVAVSMSGGSKARRIGDVAAAMHAVQKRGLAFLFRLWTWVLGPSATLRGLLKVDILNVMGLSIIGAATIWGCIRGRWTRLAAFAIGMAVFVWLTPAIRSLGILAPLPDWLEGYLRPIPGLTNFSIFPWTAFVLAGAFAGVLLDEARAPSADRRLNLAFGVGGLLLALLDHVGEFLLHSPRSDDRGARRCVFVGAASDRRQALESAAGTRPEFAVHLLDSRRDGLRSRVASASWGIHPRRGLGGADRVHGADGAGSRCEGLDGW
jgi:uncharacterized membrane protein